MASILADRTMPNTGGWQDRHDAAVQLPRNGQPRKDFETAIVEMIKGWAKYAEDYVVLYDSPIGQDGVLGDYWEAIGDGLRGLLNGATGRLDCGTLDGYILRTMAGNGVSTDSK